MIYIVDPTLKSSSSYREKRKELLQKSIRGAVFLLLGLCIISFIVLLKTSTLDTTPKNTIEIDSKLKITPGSNSPTGRIPAIPHLPTATQ